MHLTPLRIKCNPTLLDKNTALKFVQDFFKRIENSFRNIYNGYLLGITKDLTLYVYVCNGRNYPE